MLKKALFFFMIAAAGCVEIDEDAFSNVKHEDGKIYLVDLRAHKWDITQAVSLGFEPKKFQYGIGRNAFTPLDDSMLTGGGPHLPEDMRVIGIGEGPDSRAYSVRRLSRHEIANSTLGEKPVAVGY